MQPADDRQSFLTTQRRAFGRATAAVSAVTLPIAIYYLHFVQGDGVLRSTIVSVLGVAAARGLADVAYKRFVQWPSLFGTDSPELREEDALHRRRAYFWSRKFRLVLYFLGLVTFVFASQRLTGHADVTWPSTASAFLSKLHGLANPAYLAQMVMLPLFFLFNFLILFGPLMATGASQMKVLEPGDADLGVKLSDVRGQKEAKAEIEKVLNLWQAGERFTAAGGKRERGILFLGAPGVGKTMLAKAIATGFNCPIMMLPGSGFAQTFIGMDAVIVRWGAYKCKKAAAKWGGQCIWFIDEIDAVGMRRQSLLGQLRPQMPGGMMGGMGGGLALNQLLVVMDGIDAPPMVKQWRRNRVNTWLDALYFPLRVRGRRLRLPKAKPAGGQIYFIGATNVPLEALDPALTRPGRMGRHIYFRNPTLGDRKDIFDLYLGKVSHEAELDTDAARTELARVTNGYSPAQIDQVCSLALTYAHHEGRDAFSRQDLLEAMVTVEAGTAIGWDYTDREEKAIAVHEAGHAVCSHLYMTNNESTRLSVRRRGFTGGHHQAPEKEERFSKFSMELFHEVVWGLGAYAAELVFYQDSSQGVGGDLGQANALAGTMVGRWGMTAPFALSGEEKRKVAEVGNRLLTAAGPTDVKLDPLKLNVEKDILGQAFILAYETIKQNEAAVEKIAVALCREKEIYGNDLLRLLDSCELVEPDYSITATATELLELDRIPS